MVNLYFIEKLSLNVSTRIIDESLGSSTHYGKDSNIGSQFKIKMLCCMHLSYTCTQQIIVSNQFICLRCVCMQALHRTELKYSNGKRIVKEEELGLGACTRERDNGDAGEGQCWAGGLDKWDENLSEWVAPHWEMQWYTATNYKKKLEEGSQSTQTPK